jgi:hypothetical protein
MNTLAITEAAPATLAGTLPFPEIVVKLCPLIKVRLPPLRRGGWGGVLFDLSIRTSPNAR